MDIEAIRKQVEQQVMQYFHLEPTVTDAPYAGMVTGVDVISHLEHSLLNPDTTLETIERECAVARKYSVAAVCVAPYYVPAAREILLGSPVAVGTAIGFPHGCMSQAAKLAELRECMANGATEVDVALNVWPSIPAVSMWRSVSLMSSCAVRSARSSSRPCSSMRSTRRRRSAPFCRCCAAAA